MKKYIALATLLFSGATFVCANTNNIVVSTPWYDGKVGNYHGFQLDFDSVANLGYTSASDYSVPSGLYDIDTLALVLSSGNDFTDTTKWSSGASTYLVVLNSDNKIRAISSGASYARGQQYANQSNKGLVSFSFDTSDLIVSTADSALKVFFVSSVEGLSIGGSLTTDNFATARFIGSTYDGISGATVNKSINGTFGGMTPCIQYTMSLIPEPSAFGFLAGLGALALVGTRRRRR